MDLYNKQYTVYEIKDQNQPFELFFVDHQWRFAVFYTVV